ncbi:MAG: universal stress protein [Alphaproteobacteria bacterium]|nr:universal stress protein [Alphaproteobacteria bacterium]
MSEPSDPSGQAAEIGPSSGDRVFLVVVDESAEQDVALRFACLRARRTGARVALLHVIEPPDFQHWMAVDDLMREEMREEAETLLHKLSGVVNELTGKLPELYVREGDRAKELLNLIEQEPSISVLVLGADPTGDNPGPLVSLIVGKMSGRLRIPITVVPGSLTEQQIEELT